MTRATKARQRALDDALLIASDQEGIISVRQLYALGVSRWQVRAELRARRWQRITDQSVCVHTGPLSDTAHAWAAVLQGGPSACLDGASALVAAGLERFTVDRVRVSVPRGARVRRTAAYDIRQTRRWARPDIVRAGIPRTRPPVAAVRGALWARSDRQAVLLLTMTVQQRIARAEDIGVELLRVRRDRRRPLLQAVLLDLLGGVQTLGELDVAHELRRRELPEPERQVVRKDARGRYYLDLCWPAYGLVVEVDGIQHQWAEQIVGDALRQNAVAIAGDTVLRLPLLGLRLEPESFFTQIEQALTERGWRRDVMRTEGPEPRSA